MHRFLALGVLIALAVPAAAAAKHHPGRGHHILAHRRARRRAYAAPGWIVVEPHAPSHYDDTPSYDDPSKFGGGTAL